MEDKKNFHVEYSFWKNMATLILDVPLLLETFRSIVFLLLSNQIVFKRFVNGKQPMLTITVKPFFEHLVENMKWIFGVFLIPFFDTTIWLQCFCISHQELRERVLRGKYRIPFYMSTGM